MSRDIVIYTGQYGAEEISKAIEHKGNYLIAQSILTNLYKKGLINETEKERLDSMLSSSDEGSKELARMVIENLKNEQCKHTRNKSTRKQHPFKRFR